MNITIKNLDFHYHSQHVLKNIHLEIMHKELFVILGPNGSGKTTLLRSLSGVLKPKKECVYLGLKDIATMTPRQIALQLTAIEPEIKSGFNYSVRDIVSLGRIVHSTTKKIDHDKIINESLLKTNTFEFSNKSIFALSSGERQRVWLAMALAQQPQVLILDEPTSHLDIKHQLEVLTLVKNLSKSITIIATVHDINLAVQYSTRLALVKNGQIRFVGKPQEIITKQTLKEIFEIDLNIIKDGQEFIAIVPETKSKV